MKKTSKIKTFYVLPPGMMLMHVLKIQKQAQEDGVDPVKAVGEWAQTAALELAAQTNETSVEFTAQIQRLTNKRMAHQGGAPRGNRNAAKSAKTSEKREEKEGLNNKNSTSVRKGAQVEHLRDDFSREKGPEKKQGCFEVVLENPEKCPETAAIPGYAGQNDENQPSEKSNKNNSGPKKFAKSAPGCFENGARLFQKSPEVVFQNRAKNGENSAKSGKKPQTDESEKQPVVLKKSTSTRKSAGEKRKREEKEYSSSYLLHILRLDDRGGDGEALRAGLHQGGGEEELGLLRASGVVQHQRRSDSAAAPAEPSGALDRRRA